MHTKANHIHHTIKNKKPLLKNSSSNHNNTRADKNEKQKLDSTIESKICINNYLRVRTWDSRHSVTRSSITKLKG